MWNLLPTFVISEICLFSFYLGREGREREKMVAGGGGGGGGGGEGGSTCPNFVPLPPLPGSATDKDKGVLGY